MQCLQVEGLLLESVGWKLKFMSTKFVLERAHTHVYLMKIVLIFE